MFNSSHINIAGFFIIDPGGWGEEGGEGRDQGKEPVAADEGSQRGRNTEGIYHQTGWTEGRYTR